MSALTDAETRIRDIAEDVKAKFDEIVTSHLPVIHDAAESLQRLTTSKIVVELQQLAGPLDPPLEEAIAAIIRGAGAAAAKVAELTAPAGLDAEPEPDPEPDPPAAPAPA